LFNRIKTYTATRRVSGALNKPKIRFTTGFIPDSAPLVNSQRSPYLLSLILRPFEGKWREKKKGGTNSTRINFWRWPYAPQIWPGSTLGFSPSSRNRL